MGEPRMLIAILPWLNIEGELQVGSVHFIPFDIAEGDPTYVFTSYHDDIVRILCSYRDLYGKVVTSCTLTFADELDPCSPDVDVRRSYDAAQLLAFSAISANHYCRDTGNYANSSCFQLICQGFSPGDEFLTLRSRRRDGLGWLGGVKHGEVQFAMPLQCSNSIKISFDHGLIDCLGHVLRQETDVARRILQSVWLFNEACMILPQFPWNER